MTRRRPAPSAPHLGFRVALGGIAIAAIVLAAVARLVPLAVPAWYATLSLATYVAYARDKGAAERRARRTPENTLHVLGLLGGWPGALVAQQRFRHKTAKLPFQVVFWMTVAANLALLAWWLASAP